MPVTVPDDLPALDILRRENIEVKPHRLALLQDIRPLRIAIVNLMPLKSITETQLLRLLGLSPLQTEVTLVRLGSHESKNTPPEYLAQFYKDFSEVENKHFDGLIITGAPVEILPFEKVKYWDELCRIIRWSRTHVYSTVHICWGAQAGLYYHYGIEKYPLPQKEFGVFTHRVLQPHHPLLRGFDEEFSVPHSRHTQVRREDVCRVEGLQILAESPEVGVCIMAREDSRQIFITGHPEYDRDTLLHEYARDAQRGLNPVLPRNYFPHNDPCLPPVVTWRAHANLLFLNWLNAVYQATPFKLDKLQPL